MREEINKREDQQIRYRIEGIEKKIKKREENKDSKDIKQ